MKLYSDMGLFIQYKHNSLKLNIEQLNYEMMKLMMRKIFTAPIRFWPCGSKTTQYQGLVLESINPFTHCNSYDLNFAVITNIEKLQNDRGHFSTRRNILEHAYTLHELLL